MKTPKETTRLNKSAWIFYLIDVRSRLERRCGRKRKTKKTGSSWNSAVYRRDAALRRYVLYARCTYSFRTFNWCVGVDDKF